MVKLLQTPGRGGLDVFHLVGPDHQAGNAEAAPGDATLPGEVVAADPRLHRTCAIAVIAKAPVPGHVKTRLQSVLAPEEAAAMGAAFVQDTLANLVQAAAQMPIAPFVAYAPAGEEARFDGMLPPGTQLVLADGTRGNAPGVAGFGRVLLDVTRTLLARGYGAVCVLGADSPTLPTAELVRAAQVLLSGETDAVLGPAEDGGYWLLGLTAPHAAPYADIAWSTETVAADTRIRLDGAGLRRVELATWHDIDDRAALLRLVTELERPGSAFAAPATAALVAAFGIADRVRA